MGISCFRSSSGPCSPSASRADEAGRAEKQEGPARVGGAFEIKLGFEPRPPRLRAGLLPLHQPETELQCTFEKDRRCVEDLVDRLLREGQ